MKWSPEDFYNSTLWDIEDAYYSHCLSNGVKLRKTNLKKSDILQLKKAMAEERAKEKEEQRIRDIEKKKELENGN